jgi:uncharacterized protein (DUF2267 family)
MDAKQFLNGVQEKAALPDHGAADRAARATLQTLGERIIADEAIQLSAQLPPELGDVLASAGTEADPFDADEFVQRVADRAGLDEPGATRAAQAVFAVTAEAVTAGEWHDVVSELPNDFAPLLTLAGGMPRRHT